MNETCGNEAHNSAGVFQEIGCRCIIDGDAFVLEFSRRLKVVGNTSLHLHCMQMLFARTCCR